jgi:hypothetical protein
MSEQPTNEVNQEFGEKLRNAITVAMEIAELTAVRRMERAHEAQAKSDAERAEAAARLQAERDGAMPVMRQPWDATWWRRAEPQEIAHAWQITSGWTGADDPYARTTLDHMSRQIKQRYGIDVPDQPIPPASWLHSWRPPPTPLRRRPAPPRTVTPPPPWPRWPTASRPKPSRSPPNEILVKAAAFFAKEIVK